MHDRLNTRSPFECARFGDRPPPSRTHTLPSLSALPVKPDVNQAELEKIEQDPQAFFSQAMLSGAMIDVISDIEDKHAKILEIERCTQYRLFPYLSHSRCLNFLLQP
jgi:hypothetical protein